MGTNYYWHANVCEHCKRSEAPVHIGKSSAGWCFSLHVYPDGIGYEQPRVNTLEDWKALWSQPGSVIKDEYGDAISPEDMEERITQRRGPDAVRPSYYDDRREMARNHAEPGPNNLWRHQIGHHVIAHGPGTYDLIVGEFS